MITMMKKFLFLAIVFNFANAFELNVTGSAFKMKVTGMCGIHETYIKSDLAFKHFCLNNLSHSIETHSFIKADGKTFDAFTTKSAPFLIGLFDFEIIKINNIKIGFLGGYSIAKINASLNEYFHIKDLVKETIPQKQTKELAEYGNNDRIETQHLFKGSINHLFGPYIGYSIKKIDIFVGAGASLIKGEYTLLFEKKIKKTSPEEDHTKCFSLNRLAQGYSPQDYEVHRPGEVRKYIHIGGGGGMQKPIFEIKDFAMNLFFGAEYHINNKVSINAMCVITLPVDLKFKTSAKDTTSDTKEWIDIYKDAKFRIHSTRFLIGATYRIL